MFSALQYSPLARLWVTLFAALVLTSPTACGHKPPPGFTSIEAAPEYQNVSELDAAWKLPPASAFKEAGFQSQENGSLCGPTSIINTLASMDYRAGTQEQFLKKYKLGFFGFLPGGLTLDQLADLIVVESGFKVETVRNIDLAAFRSYMAAATDSSKRIIINFTREPLFGRGGGHHSPIGGYDAGRDFVFVLDVNEKYKPWLVKTERLYEAMNSVDSSSGKKRGLLIISRQKPKN